MEPAEMGTDAPARPKGSPLRKLGAFAAIVAAWLALDVATKAYFNGFALGSVVGGPYLGLVQFRLVHNTGMAWGLFGDSTFALGVMSAVVCVVLTAFLLANLRRASALEVVGLALVVAGGLGNAIDRFSLGYVVDFIETVFMDFPVFNVADIGVTCGFVIFIVGLFLSMRREEGFADARRCQVGDGEGLRSDGPERSVAGRVRGCDDDPSGPGEDARGCGSGEASDKESL